jgi:DNA/RNA endonuclease YhcR with UshA esterase domain
LGIFPKKAAEPLAVAEAPQAVAPAPPPVRVEPPAAPAPEPAVEPVVQADPEPESPRESAPAIEPVLPSGVIDARDLVRLKEMVGLQMEVGGTVQMFGENKKGTIYYLNFDSNYRDALALVFFISDNPSEYTPERLQDFVGKKVSVKGTVEEYQSTLQMRIRSLEQIRVSEE